MSVYEIYYENNKKFNFWVQRDSWGWTVAKVISIGDIKEGKPLGGRKPYYKNQKIMAEFYTVIDKKLIFDNVSELSCGGTNQYNFIESTDELNNF